MTAYGTVTIALAEGASAKQSRRREGTPSIWAGCDFFAWVELLARNHFAVHWSRWHIACLVTGISVFNTLLRYMQELLYGTRVEQTQILEDPLFIIGHPRTGTTFLHQLLTLDERHTYPTTYECFVPNHFLLTERLFTRCFGFLLPETRPIDNVALGWQQPQEDEFALCMIGQPSFYQSIAFPNQPLQCEEYLDLEGLQPQALERWKKSFLRFLQALTFKDPRRLVLKSPPHTCRIKVLIEMFPGARFVHIVRDPYVVFPSTVNMVKLLYRDYGLQRPTFAGLEEYVFQYCHYLYERLDEGRKLVDPANFYELHYEDLVRDPVGQISALYEHLGLGGFEELRPRLEQHLASTAGYQTNRYDLSPGLRAEISHRLGWIVHKYGYAEE